MLSFNPRIAQQTALGVYGAGVLNGLRADIDKSFVRANDRFAVVEIRAVMESAAAFGVAHAVVVLPCRRERRTVAGLTTYSQSCLATGAGGGDEPVRVCGRRLGRQRWHRLRAHRWLLLSMATIACRVRNSGGTTVGRERSRWLSGRRELAIAGTGPICILCRRDVGNLRTRTTGRFADAAGMYRWRVWSLGTGGTSAISSWRTVNILTQ